MFWKLGGYSSISPIDAILDRPHFTLEELLDESDLLGDIKARNTKLLEYLCQKDVVARLLEFVVAPKPEPPPPPGANGNDGAEQQQQQQAPAPEPPAERGRSRIIPFGRSRASSSATDAGAVDEEEDVEKKRARYAFVACEILSSDDWAMANTILTDRAQLHRFWQFLKRPEPLDPLQASYFTKVNESLFDKKVEDMVDFLKSADNAVQDMLRHVDCPMIMDLLLKIITLDRPEAFQGIVEWLYTQDVMPTLVSFLSPANSWSTQTSAADFIKAIITVSANATQREQTCIGPNELTRQLVSHPCIDEMIGYMLKGGNALSVGVGIVIEVIRKNNSDYDPDVGTEANSIPSSRDPIYLGTLLRMFAQNVPNFMQLMNNAPAQKTRLNSTFGEKIEPLGFDRFKTCELMAELLHCSNMGLLNEVGAEEVIAIRDAQRKRLRHEGKLSPDRGEMPSASTADLLAMDPITPTPMDEGRRLGVTNVSAADEDGFEEVTHIAGLGDDDSSRDDAPHLPSMTAASSAPHASPSFMDRDEDDFVDEPLSSPRLKTHDDAGLADFGHHFDDPDLVVAPLSPNKKPSTLVEEAGTAGVAAVVPPLAMSADATAAATSTMGATPATTTTAIDAKDDLAEGAEDFVTEATEPALGDEAKRMVPDLEKGDDSDSSIMFTPTISSLSESLDLASAARPPSPPAVPATSSTAAADEPPSVSSEAQASSVAASEASPTAPADAQSETQPETQPKGQSEAQPESTKMEVEQEAQTATSQATNDGMPAAEPEAEFGDASIIVTHQPAQADVDPEPADEPNQPDPVVGDFLKMQFVDHHVVPTILSFFFSYPWNNFLHNVVYDVVQQVFNGPMDRGFNPNLAISLFESADITTQIINGQMVSDQSQAATKLRMGYMGHLTLIAEEVVKFTERNPPELLSKTILDKIMSPDWTNYIDGTLTETRERDNATLGGVRPDVNMGNHVTTGGLSSVGLGGLDPSSLGLSDAQAGSSSKALAEAGLIGGFDLNGGLDVQGSHDGPFSISAGISSGFHSSSDEDDDDAEDNDEDINNEFRAYTDPLNASSSLQPPAIPPPPPPPPPLNVPPSRARQLLAARLAMNKRNAESAASQENGGDGDVGSSADGGPVGSSLLGLGGASGKSLSGMFPGNGSERIRNPFADDNDDEDGDIDADEDDDDVDDEDEEAGLNGGDVGRVGLGWNRGSWWRSMVRPRDRSKTSGSGSSEKKDGASSTTAGGMAGGGGFGNERFGDGRDSSSDGNSSGAEDDVDDELGEALTRTRRHSLDEGDDDVEIDDEEFGDFAMPESENTAADVSGSVGGQQGGSSTTLENSTGATSDNGTSSASASVSANSVAFDVDRDTMLFRPLALHPGAPTSASSGGLGNHANSTPGGSLWRLGFLGANNVSIAGSTTATGDDGAREPSAASGAALEAASESASASAPATATTTTTSQNTTTLPSSTQTGKPQMSEAGGHLDDELEVLDEHGQKVARVTEATRRTSIEDDDEVVV